jgi:hypothetical protein
VWYCSIKGYKPWLQPDSQNTRTNDQGGQTIWYDERQLLQVRPPRQQGRRPESGGRLPGAGHGALAGARPA